MPSVPTTWNEMTTWYDGLAEDDPDRYEFTAFVYMTCARAAWRRADLCRASAARRSLRERST